jgi:hypothetical protein
VFLELLFGAFTRASTFETGVQSMLPLFSALLAKLPLSAESELLTGGDGVLNFRALKYNSRLVIGVFSSSSLVVRNLLCFPDDELLICQRNKYHL